MVNFFFFFHDFINPRTSFRDSSINLLLRIPIRIYYTGIIPMDFFKRTTFLSRSISEPATIRNSIHVGELCQYRQASKVQREISKKLAESWRWEKGDASITHQYAKGAQESSSREDCNTSLLFAVKQALIIASPHCVDVGRLWNPFQRTIPSSGSSSSSSSVSSSIILKNRCKLCCTPRPLA